MSLFRSRTARSTTSQPRGTSRALARALAAAPTPESRHELVALSTRL